MIGSQNEFAFRISIDEHRLTVMSIDGALLKPVEVDFLIVQTGERYDFIIDGKSDAKLSDKYDFMIRAETLETYPPENENQTRKPLKATWLKPFFTTNLQTNLTLLNTPPLPIIPNQ